MIRKRLPMEQIFTLSKGNESYPKLIGNDSVDTLTDKFVIVELCKVCGPTWAEATNDNLWFCIELWGNDKKRLSIETGDINENSYKIDIESGDLDDLSEKMLDFIKYLLTEF
jgi:hypothetical protein